MIGSGGHINIVMKIMILSMIYLSYKYLLKFIRNRSVLLLACTSYGSTDVTIADNMKSKKLCSCQVLDYLFKKYSKNTH